MIRKLLITIALLAVPALASVQTCAGAFNIITTAAGNTQVVNFPGGCATFTPKILFFSTTGQTSASTGFTSNTIDMKASWGFATATNNRMCYATSSAHAVTPAATAALNRLDSAVCSVTTAGALEANADITSIGSGTFTLTVSTQFPNSYVVAFFAIGGSDITNANITEYTKTKSGIGTQNYTLNFANPSAMIFFGGSPGLTVAPSVTTSNGMVFGVWDGNNSWYNGSYSTSGAASSSTKNVQDFAHVMAFPATTNSTSPGSFANILTVSGTTLTLNWFNQSNTPTTTPFYILEIAGGKWAATSWLVSHTVPNVTGVSNSFPTVGAIFWTGGNTNIISPNQTGTWEPVWGFVDQNNNGQAMCAKDANAANPTNAALGYCSTCGMYRIELAGSNPGIQYDTMNLTSTGFTGTTSVSNTVSDDLTFALLVGSNTGGSNVSGNSINAGPSTVK